MTDVRRVCVYAVRHRAHGGRVVQLTRAIPTTITEVMADPPMTDVIRVCVQAGSVANAITMVIWEKSAR